MKRMLFLGALVLGVTVCSQSYGFEILDRVLGHHRRASCTSCAADPGCGAGNGCADACEPGCGAGNGCLGGGAEPGCGAGNGCGCGAEPGCGAGNGCAEPACGAGNGCADAGCTSAPKCRKAHKSILGGFFKALHSKKCNKSCTSGGCTSGCGDACEPGCGADPGCGAGNGCSDPACGAVGMIETVPTQTAARKTSKMVQVSRTVTAK